MSASPARIDLRREHNLGRDSMKSCLKRDAARYPEATRVRIHRALSWLERAEKESKDPDATFIFLWIAFNAACA